MALSQDFYRDLPEIQDFSQIHNIHLYKKVPEDWTLFLCDIKNSTNAITKGKYKEINMASVFCIVAITNILQSLHFPFVFGGDGVTFLIHSSYEERAKQNLFQVKKIIYELFHLDMRIGYIQLKELYSKNLYLKITKYKASDCYYQALLIGNALPYFENAVKKNQYLLKDEYPISKTIDLSGFSCRWQDIPTTKDEQMAIIIEIQEEKTHELLTLILNKLYEIYGEEKNWHPVSTKNMNLVSPTAKTIDIEAKVSYVKFPLWFRKILIHIEMFLIRILIRLPFPSGIRINYQDITNIKQMNYVSSDYKKLENSLKLIISTTREEKEKFINFLEELKKAGLIYYGFYSDQKAHITCAVFPKSKEDVHFIDVINGGFTLAAEMLKKQKKE